MSMTGHRHTKPSPRILHYTSELYSYVHNMAQIKAKSVHVQSQILFFEEKKKPKNFAAYIHCLVSVGVFCGFRLTHNYTSRSNSVENSRNLH